MHRLLAAVLVLVAGVSPGARAAPSERGEYAVKAAFLLNFAKFIDWPARAFAGPDGPLTVCVLGADPFGSVLDETLQEERIGGLRLVAARIPTAADVGRCHIVYVSVSEQGMYAQHLERMDRRRILTVGDSPGFIAAGGHLRFYLDDNRVRFAVNPDAVAGAEFQVSSQMMRLATIERATPGGGLR